MITYQGKSFKRFFIYYNPDTRTLVVVIFRYRFFLWGDGEYL